MIQSNRRLILLGLATLTVLGLGLGGFGTQAKIAGAIITTGVIEPQAQPQIVQSEIGGSITQLLVKEGDSVDQGDVLLRLVSDQLLSDLAILNGQIDELTARAARLRAERDNLTRIAFDSPELERSKANIDLRELITGQTRLFQARTASIQTATAQITEQKRQIKNEIEGEEQYLGSVELQMSLLQAELSDAETLMEKGLLPASRVLQLQREAAMLAGTRGKLYASIARSRAKIAELDIRVTQAAAERREQAIAELRDVMAQILEKTTNKRAVSERIEKLDLRAARNGVIMGLSDLTEGSVIRPAQPLMTIVPVGGPYKALTKLSPRDIDEVELGQIAFLRFTSLGRDYAEPSEARVTRISPNAAMPKESAHPWYDVEIGLSENNNLPNAVENGIPVEIYFQTTPRSPMSYFLSPFYNYFSRAMRD